jgi:N,N'-diacetyllegionaminate synthase
MEHAAHLTRKPHTLIIAEAGVNHNGNLALALKLCDAAKGSGADIVKFQTWKTEVLMVQGTPLAAYQQDADAGWDSQFAMAKSLELPQEDFITIRDYCREIGIGFLSTPDEEESLAFLINQLQLEVIKVGSAEINNLPFLEEIGRSGRVVILSTGMASMEEVETAFNTLQRAGSGPITLLHCTSNYPAPLQEVNLRAMLTMRERFAVPVGYSDHTEGTEVAVAAVALGAVVIEKHLTLDRNMPGPDHRASIEPHTFRSMVDAIRNIEQALGDGIKRMQPSEASTRQVVMKRLVARRSIMAGEAFSTENVAARRAARGIPASGWPSVDGKAAPRDFTPDEPIELV